MTANDKAPVQARLSRCQTHGIVEATRTLPRLRFPFIITGVMRLVAMTRPFHCPQCGAVATKA